MTEARLEDSGSGLAPSSDGWFVVNVADAEWIASDTFGSGCVFESRAAWFPQFGINLSVLEPGKPNCLYHSESLERGSDDWRIVPELTPDDAEPLIEKNYGDSFEGTTLETVLSGLGVGCLVVVGAQTDACIRSTLHGAFARGYDATLVSDAHTTEDQTAWGAPPPQQVIAHTNLYWTYQTAPGRTAGTVETNDVGFGGTS